MADRPNVVWLTLESTRADHTSVCGYDRATTPHLERIADAPDGDSYGNCFAHGVWTLPSSASLLTGTCPSHHTVGMGGEALPEGVRTVPERFRELGYRTACLSTNPHLSEASGLDRGFDRMEWLTRSTLFDVAGPWTLLKYAANVRRHSAGLTTDTAKHSTGYVVTDVLERWTSELAAGDEPYFLYGHYGDPHHAYYPPGAYQDRFADGIELSVEEALDLAERHHEDLNELIAEGCPFTDAEWEALLAMYDAEIAYTDALVGRLFDHVRSLPGETVVVITADHGELFGEGGMLAHKVVVDDAVTNVPMVVHGLEALTGYEGDLLQHADVAETLLAALGGDTAGIQGIDVRREERDHCILQRGAERYRRNVEQFRELDATFDADGYLDGDLSAIRTTEFRYERGADGEALLALPDEETDVSAEHPEVADRLRSRLVDWLETEGRSVAEGRTEGEFTDEMRDQLADLGYIQ
jgi:uncharacterized sulfatase